MIENHGSAVEAKPAGAAGLVGEAWPQLSPAPVPVATRLLTCEAKPANRTTYAVSISARDRTGLLFAVLDAVQRHDSEAIIEAGFARAVEDYGVVFLVVADAVDPRRLTGLDERIRKLATEPIAGWQIPVAATALLEVRTEDRPGLLRDLAAIFQEERFRANLRDGTIEAYAHFAAGPESFEGAVPMCCFRLELELSKAAEENLADIRARVTALASRGHVKLTLSS